MTILNKKKGNNSNSNTNNASNNSQNDQDKETNQRNQAPANTRSSKSQSQAVVVVGSSTVTPGGSALVVTQNANQNQANTNARWSPNRVDLDVVSNATNVLINDDTDDDNRVIVAVDDVASGNKSSSTGSSKSLVSVSNKRKIHSTNKATQLQRRCVRTRSSNQSTSASPQHQQQQASTSNLDSSDDDCDDNNVSRHDYSPFNSEDECENKNYDLFKSVEQQERLEATFRQALKDKKGLIIKPMKEDGACLFRAVADHVYGDEEMHSTVRSHCMDYIAKNADDFKHYLTEDVNHYISRKRHDTCHGNHIEMIALAEIYSRPIEVYEYSIEPKNIFHSGFHTDNEPIRLSYHGRNHYNSVVDPYKATIGIGLGLPQYVPGLAEKNLMNDAIKQSEDFHIEKTMLDDKLKATDWEATNEEIMELVARESYLQWLKDNEKRQQQQQNNSHCSNTTTSMATCSTWIDIPPPTPPPPPSTLLSPSTATTLPRTIKSSSNSSTLITNSSSKSPIREQQTLNDINDNNNTNKDNNNCSKNTKQQAEINTSAATATVNNTNSTCSNSNNNNNNNNNKQENNNKNNRESSSSSSCSASYDYYNTINNIPPSLLGINDDFECANDDILAQVLAVSQQEYIDSLKSHQQTSTPSTTTTINETATTTNNDSLPQPSTSKTAEINEKTSKDVK